MNNENSSLLISLVKERPCLYDKNHKNFKDVNKKNNAWKDVARSCNMKVPECRIRWKTLRDKFCRENKRIIQFGEQNSVPMSTKTAEFMKQMDFLKNIIVHKNSKKKNNLRGKRNQMVSRKGSSSNTEALSAHDYVSLQLMSSVSNPLEAWPQLHEETVQYVKTESPEAESDQTKWDQNSMAYHSSVPMESCNPAENEDMEEKVPSEDSEQTQSSNSIEMELPEISLKVQDDDDDDESDRHTLQTLWNIVKNKTLNTNENYREDQVFALSLIENLSKFPPRKKTLIKGEILLLLSKFDYNEIE